jgi:hypothetical protein
VAELEETSSLPRRCAFVIQFRPETDIRREPVVGRIEHVMSGQATHFHSLEEMLAFIARVLNSVRDRLLEET